jgi:hypothetical protein
LWNKAENWYLGFPSLVWWEQNAKRGGIKEKRGKIMLQKEGGLDFSEGD